MLRGRRAAALLPAEKAGLEHRGKALADSNGYHFIIADDHPLFRGALRQALDLLYPGSVIDEAGTLEDVTARLEDAGGADLVLLDLSMPGMRGFSGLMFLRAQHPSVPVVIVSANEEPQAIRRAIGFGASGFIPKSHGIEVIRNAIEQVMAGSLWTPPEIDLTIADKDSDAARRLASLTPQQVRVLMMLSEGLLNKQIAYELSVSEATVKAHVSAILQKLGVESRTQAVIAASKIEAGSWQASDAG